MEYKEIRNDLASHGYGELLKIKDEDYIRKCHILLADWNYPDPKECYVKALSNEVLNAKKISLVAAIYMYNCIDNDNMTAAYQYLTNPSINAYYSMDIALLFGNISNQEISNYLQTILEMDTISFTVAFNCIKKLKGVSDPDVYKKTIQLINTIGDSDPEYLYKSIQILADTKGDYLHSLQLSVLTDADIRRDNLALEAARLINDKEVYYIVYNIFKDPFYRDNSIAVEIAKLFRNTEYDNQGKYMLDILRFRETLGKDNLMTCLYLMYNNKTRGIAEYMRNIIVGRGEDEEDIDIALKLKLISLLSDTNDPNVARNLYFNIYLKLNANQIEEYWDLLENISEYAYPQYFGHFIANIGDKIGYTKEVEELFFHLRNTEDLQIISYAYEALVRNSDKRPIEEKIALATIFLQMKNGLVASMALDRLDNYCFEDAYLPFFRLCLQMDINSREGIIDDQYIMKGFERGRKQ